MATGDIADAGVAPAANTEDLHPLQTIRNGVRVYGVFVLLGWLAFEILRRYLRSAYYCRERSPATKTPALARAKATATSLFGWVWPLLALPDDDVLDASGLDALFLLRFVRLAEKVAAAAIVLSAALAPVYYYGTPDAAFAAHNQTATLDAVYRMSLAYVDKFGDDTRQQWRFGVTTAAMYALCGWTCYLLRREFQEYVRRRHEFMARKDAQQYTVLIHGLPEHLRTSQTLRKYVEVLFPESVLHVYVAVECGDLEKLVQARVKVRDKLENALAKSAKTGEREQTKTKLLGTKVDAIETYQRQLDRLNKAVEMEVRSILRNQEALALRMADQAMDGDIPTLQSPAYGPEVDIETQQQQLQRERDESTLQDEFINALKKVKHGFKNTGIMRATGFVTFNTLRAAQSAQQVLQSADPTAIVIEAAPHVDDVVWENVGVSANQKSSWKLISLAATTAIILFWTIPTIFVVSLAKLDSIKDQWTALARFSLEHPWVNKILEQISPLMLSIMSALAPIIFRFLSKREGHTGGAAVENALFNKLVAYQCYVVFLLPVLGGTFLDSLLRTKDANGNVNNDAFDLNKLVNKISQAMPLQSSFFITYLMVQMGLPTSLELTRVRPIVKAAIYNVFAPKLTPRQRSSPWLFFSPLSLPGDFGSTDALGQMFLVLVLILVFTVIAPILSYFALLYLLLCDLLYRWDIVCVNDPSPNSGALWFPSLYRFCIGAVIFSEIVMAVSLGLKKAGIAATFMLLLPVVTAGFHSFVWGRFNRASVNLPLDQCVLVDTRRHQHLDDLETILEDVYKQPAMAEREPLVPDYAALASDPNEGHSIVSPPTEEHAYC